MTIKRLLIAYLCLIGFVNLPTLSAQEKADVKVEKLNNQDNKAIAKKKDKADNEFMSRLVVGARVNLDFGSNGFGTLFNVGVHPMAAYRLTDFLRAGPSIGYSYTSYSNAGGANQSYSIHAYGGGVFLDVRPLPMEQLGFISNIYIKGEIGYYGANVIDGLGNNITPLLSNRFNSETSRTMVGLGYSSNFGRGASFQIEYLYNTTWSLRDELIAPYPLEFRAAVMYGF